MLNVLEAQASIFYNFTKILGEQFQIYYYQLYYFYQITSYYRYNKLLFQRTVTKKLLIQKTIKILLLLFNFVQGFQHGFNSKIFQQTLTYQQQYFQIFVVQSNKNSNFLIFRPERVSSMYAPPRI
eukprot:TRINITY_DN9051_c0_g2_i1.p5 TRINITY_DN9051_c0_g2~~TRINITY_DN9051_c0_g2_i1.p5  ORF type:complete len:125 (+),score=1.70 TRINITY_DN9051_c0_g2_i1:412-786(+)